MANYIRTHKLTFDTNITSPVLEFDPRDRIIALKTSAAFVGITLAAHFSFDDGTTFQIVNDNSGTQICIISDASLASGSAYSINTSDWDVTNILRFVSSSAIEVGVLTIITKRRL